MSETQEMNGTANDGNEIIATYLGMDMGYQQGKVMEIIGKKDAVGGVNANVGTLALPLQAPGVQINPDVPDPVMFSYLWNGQLRELLVKIKSQGGQPSTCTFDVLVPSADGDWVTRASDINLVKSDGSPASFNPHSLAQSGSTLFITDYENQWQTIVDTNLLEAVSSGGNVVVPTFDLSVQLNNVDAKGQASIIVNSKLYALYIVTDATATSYQPSQLVRMSIGSGGFLTFDTKTRTGLNSQSIIPVNNGPTLYLIIPSIGGPQSYTGQTNGKNSTICYVIAEGSWSATAPSKVTGDDAATPLLSYDIHGIGAAMRNENSALYILTQIYDNNSRSALWRIYYTTVGNFLLIPDGTTLSNAVGPNRLTVVDEGTANATDPEVPYGIYFWDILYEQTPAASDDGDRLWVAMGTPILVTRAGENFEDPGYGSPTALFQNAYAMFGYLGGTNVNMNGMDLTVEATNQAKRGNVSLKRTLRTSQTPKPTEEDIAAATAARAAKK
jgi:hypothetical protein